LVADCADDALGQQSADNFANADGPHAGLLVEGYEAACHQSSIGGPRRVRVGHPTGPIGQFLAEQLGRGAEAQKPVLQGDGIGAAGSGAS
jgi:hypothetical protein